MDDETTDDFSPLDDLLLSLADGISQAQVELSRAASAGPGGQPFVYHLPRVDFELKMNIRVVQNEALASRYQRLRAAPATGKHLVFRPLGSQEASSVVEVAAVVRGAFVAVPANAGLPPAAISTSVIRQDARSARVEITARNAAGEPLVGVDVEVNVDREESVALSAASGRTMTVAAGTQFERAIVTTDSAGVATAVLQVAATQQPGLLVLVLDALGQTETLVYEVTA
jgi:hypothetical protein